MYMLINVLALPSKCQLISQSQPAVNLLNSGSGQAIRILDGLHRCSHNNSALQQKRGSIRNGSQVLTKISLAAILEAERAGTDVSVQETLSKERKFCKGIVASQKG